MSEKNIKGTQVDTVLSVKATGSLREQVQQELLVSTPNPEVAKAMLEEGDEDTDTNEPKVDLDIEVDKWDS